jgi:hypothetical protein
MHVLGLQVIDSYPSEWDFLKSHIADMKLLTTQQVRRCGSSQTEGLFVGQVCCVKC